MANGKDSGRDATRPRGRPYPRRPDDYGFNGSASAPPLYDYVGGAKVSKGAGEGASRVVGRRPDEIDRSSVKTSASHRSDHAHGSIGSQAVGFGKKPYAWKGSVS